MRLSEDSIGETEQTHVLICPELFRLAAIGQDLGIAGSARREPIGQLLLAQQAAEAQQDFAFECAANNNTDCTHQSMNATSNSQPFCRRIAPS